MLRGLRMISRVPERLSDVTIQPVMFTFLFLYVFGSAIHVPGIRYQDYLLPGLLGQSVAFGVIGAGVATATDFTTGVIDRFRSLPVTRLSVISSQVIGQIIEQILGILIVTGIGLALGWHPHLGGAKSLELVGLMLLGLFAFTWFGVLMAWSFEVLTRCRALASPSCSRVVPSGNIRADCRDETGPPAIAEWDPLSAFVAAIRYVCQGTPSGGSPQLDHPVIAMILWCVAITAICVPLALRRFKTATS